MQVFQNSDENRVVFQDVSRLCANDEDSRAIVFLIPRLIC
jgi:hypothetical protein